MFSIHYDGLDKYFDKIYYIPQTAKRLKEAHGTVHIIILSERETLPIPRTCCCKDEDLCSNKKRFDPSAGFEISRIMLPLALRCMRKDAGIVVELFASLAREKPADPVFLVLYLDIDDKVINDASPTLGLARFLNKINDSFGENLAGYEINTVEKFKLAETRGRITETKDKRA